MSLRLAALAALLVSGTAGQALAQGQPLSESALRAGAPKAPKLQNTTQAPPRAVPGAVARPDSVAPADKNAADLPPTEALFDAINRGDIITARDAITRGADLDGTNLLGLTPLELSVDLGRNDISFLLLSLRGTGGSDHGPQPRDEAATAAPPSPAERRKAQQEAAAQARLARKQQVAANPQAAPAHGAPALFAGNGGTPAPQAGFLGFDPHR